MSQQSWRDKRRLKQLAERGTTALATVLEFDERWRVSESGHSGIQLGHSDHYTLKIRVEPPGQPAFETEVKEHDFFTTDDERPQPGDTFAVLFDPDDHSKIVRDELDRDSLVGPRKDPVLNFTMPDPAEQARFHATILENLEAKRTSGELTEEQYAKKKAVIDADFAAQAAADAPPAPSPPRDVAAQLTDLAKLHADGNLTDAEFDEQKRRLLAGDA